MDTSVLVQKQVRDNSEDLQSEFLDLKNWEEQMKRKDEELRNKASGEVVLPPVRSKAKKKPKVTEAKQGENPPEPKKKIKSYDYTAWDKFDVEKACKDIDKEEKSDVSEDEVMSKEELEKAHTAATKHKNEGNAFVQKQEWVKAIACYNQAIKLFPYDAVFYANRALCQLKLDNLHSAESDCSAALQLDEAYVKAYHRRATARVGLKQYKEAKQDLNKVLKLEPSNKEAKSLLAQVEKKIESSKPVIISGENLGSDVSIEKRIAEKLCGTPKEKSEAKGVKKDNKKDSKIEIVKEEDRFDQIPQWLPEKDDVAVIETVKRPAHLRSKKPGIKIPVEEIAFEDIRNIQQVNKIKADSNQDIDAEKVIESENHNSNKLLESKSNEPKVTEVSETVLEVLTVPKTAVQFLMQWKRNKSPEYRFKYLKQLTPGSMATIFQDSMESDIFSDILELLRTKFITKHEPVFQYLEDLSKVKRFKALIMFMSNKDKEGLRTLFEYCKKDEGISEAEVQKLSEHYEV